MPDTTVAPDMTSMQSAAAATHTEHTEVPHAEPELFGLAPFQIVSSAMFLLFLIMIWKKVPAMIVGGLDKGIAAIKAELDEAKALRAEAEALRDEYVVKMKEAEEHAEAMVHGAQAEAESILAKAEADGKAMIARRKKMAEDKIASAERNAVNEVRQKAASAAAVAAKGLIVEGHDAAADSKLADQLIGEI